MKADQYTGGERPVIAVTPLYDDKRDRFWILPAYYEGITEAGGLPILLPLTADRKQLEQCVKMCDGVLFTGGQDVSPAMYGEQPFNETVHCCEKRDGMEATALELAIELDRAVLGICRGIQLINAVLGGNLYQDLPVQHPSELCPNQEAPYDRPVHEVHVVKGTPLEELLCTDTLRVNSLHHQAVKELAPSLQKMAVSADGLTEALCRPASRFLWAVQWHSEYMYQNDSSARAIFKRFVEAAAGFSSYSTTDT